MNDTDRISTGTAAIRAEPLTIRMATPDDVRALIRLAQLDSAPPPTGGPTLVAEAAGELRAAVALDGGPATADPFHRTARTVALLEQRRLELQSVPAQRTRLARWRPARFPRPAHGSTS